MKIEAHSVDDYFSKVPSERQNTMNTLRSVINSSLPDGFQECLGYGMPSWVVPHSIYPSGYHTTPHLPLPFMSLASQKNFIGLYHMGIYANPNLLDWWKNEFARQSKRKLNMGKSCIRFKYIDDIPFDLIAELCTKISVNDWIKVYEKNIKR